MYAGEYYVWLPVEKSIRRKALRLKDKAERLERWARRCESKFDRRGI
jgi:hypothetical protein